MADMTLLPDEGTLVRRPHVTMTFVSGKDDVAIAESIANHLGLPVVITRPDGTKNYVIPCETAVFDAHVAHGPMHRAEDEIGFGELPDGFGG